MATKRKTTKSISQSNKNAAVKIYHHDLMKAVKTGKISAAKAIELLQAFQSRMDSL